MNLDQIINFEETTAVGGAVGGILKAAGGGEMRGMWRIPFDKIKIIPGFNTREDSEEYQAHLGEIENQMHLDGWRETEPAEVVVIDDEICMVDGHSRYIAAQRAIAAGKQIEFIPAIAHPKGTTMKELTARLVTSNAGAPLSTLGKATVVGRLSRQYGMVLDDIASRLSMTKRYVEELLRLDASPNELKLMITNGTVSASLVLQELKKQKDGAAVLAHFKKVLEAQAAAAAEAGGTPEGEGDGKTKTKLTTKTTRTVEQKISAAQKANAADLFKFVEEYTTRWDAMEKLIKDDESIGNLYVKLMENPEYAKLSEEMEVSIDKITHVQSVVEEANRE